MNFRLSLVFLVSSLVCPLFAADTILAELDAAQAARVKLGEQVALREEVAGKPWPKVRMYQKANATPEEVAAVFFDYNNAKKYIPDLLKSDISKRVSPKVQEVDYGVDVPILPDEYYTVRNTVSACEGGAYRFDWLLLKARQTKASEGNLRIEPFGEGKAVLCYTNFVTPGSSMASVLKSQAISRMEATVKAIVRQVETQKSANPQDLSRQLEDLRKALKETP